MNQYDSDGNLYSRECKLGDVFDEVEKIAFNYKYDIPKDLFKNCLHIEGTFFSKAKTFSVDQFETIAMPSVLIIVPKKFLILNDRGNGMFEMGNWDWHKRGYGYKVPYYFLTPEGEKTRDVKEAKIIYENYGNMRHHQQDVRFLNYVLKVPEDYYIVESWLSYDAQEWLDKNHPLPRKAVSKKTRLEVYEMFGHRCAYCGEEIKDIKDLRVDHIVSYMNNKGADDISNFYPACDVCNRVKSTETLEEFKNSIRHCGGIHRKRKKPLIADSDKIAIKYDLTKEDHEITFYFEEVEKKC